LNNNLNESSKEYDDIEVNDESDYKPILSGEEKTKRPESKNRHISNNFDKLMQ
jgi:hypothetical protein